MGSKKDDGLIVALDIGTNKICAIIGENTPDGLNVIGMGTRPAKGMERGIVRNVESVSDCIREAIEDAEVMSNHEVTSVVASISGSNVKSMNSNGVARITSPQISDPDIDAVLDSATAVVIPPDRRFLHVIAQEYKIDGTNATRTPRGQTGVRLEATLHIVTCATTAAQSIVDACNRCGLEVDDIVLSPLAASEVLLKDGEKELGCVLIDIGRGTTDIAIWKNGVLVYTYVLDIAGEHITSDISSAFTIGTADAETLKIQSGCAMVSAVGSDEVIVVPDPSGSSNRKMPRQALAHIIQPRVRELFEIIKDKIEEAGFLNDITGGVIITGGTALMDGVNELATQVLGQSVRRGMPFNIGGMVDNIQNPKYSTAVGLLQHAINPPDIKSYTIADRKRRGLWGKFLDWLHTIL